ncbi:hypothetical protein Tco_0246417 [Tanacetum coccineum]
MDDHVNCRNFIDHVPPPGFWASLRNQTNAEFLDLLNVNTTQHACMVSVLRLRYEHEIEVREKFEKNFVKSAETIQQRDNNIMSLKSRLEEAEGEAAKVIRLRRWDSELEATTADELIESECEDVRSKVVGEAKLKEEFMAMHDVRIQRLEERNAELDTCVSELNYQVDSDLCPYMLTAITGHGWMIGHGLRLAFIKCNQSLKYQSALGKDISLAIDQGIQQGLMARVEHRNAGRELGELAAYDPGTKARMEALKDAPLNHLMATLYLEGSQGDEDPTLVFWRLQPILEQVTIPVYYERGGSWVPGTVCLEILLGDALEASYACAQRYRRDASSSLVVAEPVVASGPHTGSLAPTIKVKSNASSLAVGVTLVNSISVSNYQISDVSILRDIAINDDLQNQTSTENVVHDDMFDTTLLDRSGDDHLSGLSSS